MKTLVAKTWLTLKEFITIAWPLLVVSSVVLGLLEWADAADAINALLAPLTVILLGLPVAVGMTLVFGILRKELTLVMLVQALGTTHLSAVMSEGQMLTFTLFVVFYVPCVATVAVMAKELGWRDTAVDLRILGDAGDRDRCRRALRLRAFIVAAYSGSSRRRRSSSI